jgi:transposase
MSNVLKVSHQEAIRSLHEKGWSQRRIARELGINRRTVRRYRYTEGESKCTTLSTPGAERIAGREPAVSVTEPWGRKSRCAPFEAAIDAKMKAGLSAQRIYQDLVEEKAFLGSYQSVKRFVRRRKARQPEWVWRIECQPGEEIQVDFCLGAPIEGDNGKTRRSWVLRAVLSYSRKGYSEAVLRQDTESFLRCLENALRHFGGVPLLLNLDNFKAAVLRADWFDPDINPKLAEFCRHYHLRVMPCRPQMPQHHHAEVIAITGRSYRLQDSANQRTLSKPKSSPPASTHKISDLI